MSALLKWMSHIYHRSSHLVPIIYYIATVVIGIVSIYLFFHIQINSRLQFIFGDEYDGLIETVLISHWYHVLRFEHLWNQPLYFHPHEGVLGYNDGYLIYGLLGSLFRWYGFNALEAQSLVHILVKATGFLSMVCLLDRLQGRNIVNPLGAALFTLFISSSNQAVHGQLLSVALSPLLALLAIKFVEAIKSESQGATLLTGFCFLTLLNGLFLTGFYSAWFFCLFAVVYVLVLGMLSTSEAKRILMSATRSWKPMLALAGWFLLTLVPFLFVYVPTLISTGGQAYTNQLAYSLRLMDVINYGTGSMLWGGIYEIVSKSYPSLFRGSEFIVGFTPDVLILLWCVMLIVIFTREFGERWLVALVLATAIAGLLPVSISRYSLWYLVDTVIPGSDGIRAISRFYLFLTFPVAIIISAFFQRVCLAGRLSKLVAVFMLSILCASQVNLAPPTRLNVLRAMALLDRAKQVPAGCDSFFVANPTVAPRSEVDELYRQNVEAMLLADSMNVPTLNGFATFNPDDWIFRQNEGYLGRVEDYIKKHGLENVCRYDIAENTWSAP
jgi:hypothetical protein